MSSVSERILREARAEEDRLREREAETLRAERSLFSAKRATKVASKTMAFLGKGAKFGGQAMWVITTTAFVTLVPALIALAGEANHEEIERLMKATGRI